LRVWVCWQSLQVEYTGSFLVFNRACILASSCPTRAIPAFGPAREYTYKYYETKLDVWIIGMRDSLLHPPSISAASSFLYVLLFIEKVGTSSPQKVKECKKHGI
jgi:hypothetical protein